MDLDMARTFSTSLISQQRTAHLRGKRVRIVELDRTGKVITVLKNGQIAEVETMGKQGPELLEVLQYTVVLLGVVDKLVDLVLKIYFNIRRRIKDEKEFENES
jgi:hypothetical protein